MRPWATSLLERPLLAPWRHYFMAALCLIVFALGAWALNRLVQQEQTQELAELRQKVLLDASQKRAQLEGKLNAITSLTDGLVAYITAYHDELDTINAGDTGIMLSVIYSHTKNIRSIALAPGNRIAYVYPPKPNRKAIGAYYPDIKDQWPAVQRAIRLQQSVLGGPTNLVQGGRGLVHRTPVFLKDGRYWGLLSLVIKGEELFREVGLSQGGAIDYALRGQDGLGAKGKLILGRESLFAEGNVLLKVAVPAGEWQLAARPGRGWDMYAERFRWLRTFAFATALLVASWLYYLLLAASSRLLARERLKLTQFTIDHASDAIVWTDNQGHIVYLNETAARLTRQTTRSAIGRFIWELNTDFTEEKWQQSWPLIKSQGEYVTDTLLVLPDGNTRQFESTINYLRYGGTELTISFSRDVTSRRQAEEAMHRSQQQTAAALKEARRLALIVNRTSNAVILADAQGRIEWVNDSFSKMTGYGLEEVMGRRPGDFLQGKQTDSATVAYMRRQLQQEQSFRCEILNYDKHGTPFWVNIEVQPLRDERGQLSGYMAIQTDITERKEAEARLEEAQRIAHIGFWEYDNLNQTLFWSDETYRIVGMTPGEPIDSLDIVQRRVHAEDLAAFLDYLNDILNSTAPAQLECRAVRLDGEVRYVRMVGQNARGDDGTVRKLFGIVQDITEQKQAEKLKNEFISTVSHELRTPLTAMRGALGLLGPLAQTHLSGQATQLLDVTVRNAERLALLIDDLLDMEKITSGKMEFHYETLPLSDQIEQALSANQPYGDRFGVRYHCWNDCPDLLVEVDTHRLQQVMANLLANAAKFSSPGNTPLADGRVDVYVSRQQGCVRVAVQDYGLGIAPEHHGRLFQKFTQLDPSDARIKGGTGLGLTICKALVEHMGGRIGVESALAAGSTFWFELPIKQ